MNNRVIAPVVVLAMLGLLSTTIKPPNEAKLPDANCTNRRHSIVCLATFKKLEQSSRGFTMYLEGAAPYSVNASRPPTYNQIGYTFQVTLKASPMGWQLQDWTKKY